MIKYNPKNWFKLIFALHKSDTMLVLWKEILYIFIFSGVIAYLVVNFGAHLEALHDLVAVYSLVGFVISLLLVFRTNTAYDRWWEGRKKWGSFINNTRNLAIKLSALLKDEEDRDFFKRMIPNFIYASKEHLRDNRIIEELELTGEERKFADKVQHLPANLVSLMYRRVEDLKKSGKLTQEEALNIDKNLNSFLDDLGACERIKNTPIPFSYMLFLKKFIFIYVTTLPLAFVSVFGYYAAIIATFVFYVLVSMEVLAEEIEDPFGRDDNDLPTQEMALKIRTNVREIFEN